MWNCCAILNLLCDNECGTIYSEMLKSLEATEAVIVNQRDKFKEHTNYWVTYTYNQKERISRRHNQKKRSEQSQDMVKTKHLAGNNRESYGTNNDKEW